MQHNPFTTETREYPGGVPLGAQKEQADIEEKKAGAFEKTELGNKARKTQTPWGCLIPQLPGGLTATTI